MSSVESAWIALDKAVEELANAAQNLRKALREFILSLGITVSTSTEENYAIPSEYASALDDLLTVANSGMPATVIGDVLENTIDTIKEKAGAVYDFLSTTIKNIIDTIKTIVENIQKMMEGVYALLTDPAKFGEFLLNAIEEIW